MDFNSMINNIEAKEEFMNFLIELQHDNEERSQQWENGEISLYLAGICSWVEDMEGYYKNMDIDAPTNIDWKFIATLFYVGKIYE